MKVLPGGIKDSTAIEDRKSPSAPGIVHMDPSTFGGALRGGNTTRMPPNPRDLPADDPDSTGPVVVSGDPAAGGATGDDPPPSSGDPGTTPPPGTSGSAPPPTTAATRTDLETQITAAFADRTTLKGKRADLQKAVDDARSTLDAAQAAADSDPTNTDKQKTLQAAQAALSTAKTNRAANEAAIAKDDQTILDAEDSLRPDLKAVIAADRTQKGADEAQVEDDTAQWKAAKQALNTLPSTASDADKAAAQAKVDAAQAKLDTDQAKLKADKAQLTADIKELKQVDGSIAWLSRPDSSGATTA